MKQLLKIDTSTRGVDSHSQELADTYSKIWQETYTDAKVISRDLSDGSIPHLTQDIITSMFTPKEQRTVQNHETLALSDTMIGELKSADTIMISVPMFNFTIPSVLKAYIDHISRKDETFSMDETGFKGLITGKKLIIVAAYGADFSQMKAMDFVEPYLKSIFGFLGFEDINYFALEGTSMLGTEELTQRKDAIVLELEKCV
ncbi:MAG TPA: FMN-dependent NADH-azoreductase [Campylobacterales bacterium]|nr:FMN-dependent NADH-azoreductase [Campylobacterales bacterium]